MSDLTGPQAKQLQPTLKELSSLNNPLVKELIALKDSAKARRRSGRFVVEGLREVSRALRAGWTLEAALFEPSLLELSALVELIEGAQSEASSASSWRIAPPRPLLLASCTAQVFAKLAYRSSVPNAVGLFCQQSHELNSLPEPQEAEQAPLYLVVERIEKPGNLGALLRTANAMGVSAVFVCEGSSDLYHPNALRNSLGGFFDLPIVSCASEEALSWLKARGVQIITTYLEGAVSLDAIELSGATAIVLGAEDQGVTPLWVEASDALALIPMAGVVDSLNVSVAAGMALYEATRQRRASR